MDAAGVRRAPRACHVSDSTLTIRSVPIPRSRPSRSGRCAASVTTRPQSVWRMSCASSAPRLVGLIPTTAAPASAAPPSRKTYSGTLSSSTPTWKGAPSRRVLPCGSEDRRPHRAFVRDLRPRPRVSLEHQAGVRSLARGSDERGDRRRTHSCFPFTGTRRACGWHRGRASSAPTRVRRSARSRGSGRGAPRGTPGPRGRRDAAPRHKCSPNPNARCCVSTGRVTSNAPAVGPNAASSRFARRVEHDDEVALGDRLAVQFGGACRGTAEHLDRRDPSQAFLDRARDPRRLVGKERALFRDARRARACFPTRGAGSSRCPRRATRARSPPLRAVVTGSPSTSAWTTADAMSSVGCSRRSST